LPIAAFQLKRALIGSDHIKDLFNVSLHEPAPHGQSRIFAENIVAVTPTITRSVRNHWPEALDPSVILSRPVASFIPGIEHPTRLDQQQLHFAFCIGFVLNALGDDKHLTCIQSDCTVTKIDAERSFKHDEGFICFLVVMPNEVAFQSPNFELVVVHFSKPVNTERTSRKTGSGAACSRNKHGPIKGRECGSGTGQ
jgi:hypothetical protein